MEQLKNKRTLILLAVTILAALVLGYNLLFGKKGPRPGKKSSNVPTVAEVLAARPSPSRSPGMPAGTPTRRLAPPPPPNQPWGRDPFAIQESRLPATPKAVVQFSGFKITGVVWGPEGYRALVNDRVVRVGDQVDGARIVRITKKGVEILKDGETLFLTLIEKDFFR